MTEIAIGDILNGYTDITRANMAEEHEVDGVTEVDEFAGDQKRIKLEEQGQLEQQAKAHSDPHNAPPSRVVHARAVPDGCTHQQMVATLSKFGKIS